MNETLESMAQALFKSWFVDFDPVIDKALAGGKEIPEELSEKAQARAVLGDNRRPLPEEIRTLFPDEFTYSNDLGWIPEGWEVGSLVEIALLKTSSVQPKNEPETVWTHFSIPAFDENRLPNNELGSTIKSGKYMVPPTAILASKLNPQFPRVWLPDVEKDETAICSTEFMPFVPLDTHERPFLYAFFNSSIIQEKIVNRATGSTGSRQRVRPREIASMSILKPPQRLRVHFSNIAGSYYSKVAANIRAARYLEKLRNTLLPKLLSGELRIPDAEKMVEELAL
jgi:type I restriction enzyme S subunit